MVVLFELRELTPIDPDAALAAAKRKKPSWAKCQALAYVARYGPEDRVEDVARAALAAAQEADDPYHAVFASAWPLRALIERWHDQAAEFALIPLLAQSQTVTPMASRSEALFLVFQAVMPSKAGLWPDVFDALIAASTPPRHWRQARNIRDAVLMTAGLDIAIAMRTTAELDEGRLRRKLERKLDAGESTQPRAFL